ncbi:dicarboxylate/amino acid:cation symporter, partial [Candidatus Sumerlaeota bacterium]|nr:dicarboxylate/amino acid:cation symporter [Candidatus Sumerlaeota bacterium]
MKIFRLPLYLQILVGMALGAVAGTIWGKSVAPLGELGKVIITLIKTLAAPLLFFAIIDAFLHMKVRARAAGWMAGISAINAVIALAIGMMLSNTFHPGERLAEFVKAKEAESAAATTPAKAPEKIGFVKTVVGYVPESIVEPFIENSIISIILVAILLGLALRRAKEEQLSRGETAFRSVEDGVRTLFRMIEIALGWVIKFVPLAVFGVVAKTIGEYGFGPIKGLAIYVGIVLLGLALHVGIVYQGWIILAGPRRLADFWRGGRDAIVYALGASSSLATLPVTLKCLDKMGVSPHSARMAACVGTNLNNDGILLYEAMAVLFVAQANGIHLTFGQQLSAALSCAIAGVGIAGVPDAGLISLSLVLATVGLPLEILPLLLTVDWVLSRARATTNVISDMLVANLLDRFDPIPPSAE